MLKKIILSILLGIVYINSINASEPSRIQDNTHQWVFLSLLNTALKNAEGAQEKCIQKLNELGIHENIDYVKGNPFNLHDTTACLLNILEFSSSLEKVLKGLNHDDYKVLELSQKIDQKLKNSGQWDEAASNYQRMDSLAYIILQCGNSLLNHELDPEEVHNIVGNEFWNYIQCA